MRLQRSVSPTNCIFLFCLTMAAGLHAQENKPAAMPREPLLPRTPEMAAWTITYEYPADKKRGDKKTPKDRIVSVQIEKTGDIYHKSTRWDTGKQSEAWSVQGREVVQGDTSQKYVPTPADGPAADDFSKSDFEDLDWISMKHFVAPKKGANGNFVFRAKQKDRPSTRREKLAMEGLNLSSSKGSDSKSQQSPEALAEETGDLLDQSSQTENIVVLDAKSQLPTEYDQGFVKWTYEFTQPPTGRLTPPTEANILFDHWENFIKSSESSGSPP